MNICIRADGGNTIGMGHIMRTLVLAKQLSENNNVFYACRVDNPLTDKYKAGIEKIKKEGFNVIHINENNLKEELKNINAECIITDSYDVDEEYFNILKRNFKISGCLDDEKTCNYFNVDFLINQNPYAEQLNYKVNEDTKLMLGCGYVILREEFRKTHFKEIKTDIEEIMVTVGGSDNNNLTEQILKKIARFKGKVNVVVGPGFKYIDELKKYENQRIKLHFNAKMSELMKKSDLAICSCGSTLYELASCSTPTIGIVVAENQILAAKTMDNYGTIICSQIEDIYDNILKLSYNKRYEMSSKAKKLVDGNGSKRIAETIEREFNL